MLAESQNPALSISSNKPSQIPQDSVDARIAALVGVAWMMYPRYGEDRQALEAKIQGFKMVLRDYPLAMIEGAFGQWLKTGGAFPTAADIVNIIEPPKQKLSVVMYMEIKRRQAQGHYIWDDTEKGFLKKFEEQEYDKLDSHTRKNFENEISQEKQKFLEISE